MKKRHFTMLEGLVIVAIIAVLIALATRIMTKDKPPAISDYNELNAKVVGRIDKWWPVHKFA